MEASQRHRVGVAVKPALHRFDQRLMLPARDAPVVGQRALGLHRAAGALTAPVAPNLLPVFSPREPLDGVLSCRALVLVVSGDLDAVALVEAAHGLGGG